MNVQCQCLTVGTAAAMRTNEVCATGDAPASKNSLILVRDEFQYASLWGRQVLRGQRFRLGYDLPRSLKAKGIDLRTINWKRAAQASGGAMAAVAVALSVASPAMANDSIDITNGGQAVDAAYSTEESIADTRVPLNVPSDSAASTASANGVDLTLPSDTSTPVTIQGEDTTLEFTLPASEASAAAEVVGSDSVAYDNNDGSYTVPIVGDTGDLQVNTVVSSADAPTTYDYTFEFPAGFTSHENDGALVFLSAESELLLMMAPPWAKDANGADVPTHYELNGTTVTQVVEHDDNYAYPIVADPWLGIQLFGGFYQGTWNGDKTYNATVTPQAVLALGLGGGVIGEVLFRAVMNDSGWKEWTKKWPAVTNKSTIKQQFACHVQAGIIGLPFTGTYNLERARVNRSDWMSHVWSHRCNWRYSTGGQKS